ncbi:acetoacetate decarboxylase [Streptomyces sp. 3214.6]|uniref:acetoacetate decarboxylase n=1 Tax=Streptomyces sp. 3214.6 TaxID=1882757 RepID=UPI000909E941|nr:acetoacetate decarboxylase [Streptomyces sp. 3214.6]SHH73038.1 acetoacetate decarboxylase [Streptomyces sp. 3214.6]
MRESEVARQALTPLGVPVYPVRATRFTDREYFNIVYRTDPDALRAVVPEPLTVPEPLVRFEVMKMGDVEGFGPYLESGQAIAVEFDGEVGEYLHAMYLDSFAATAAGRELSAYPKVAGSPALFTDTGALVGTLDRGGQRVATATMPYKWQPLDLDAAREQITVPTFALKQVPNVFTGQLRASDLVRTEITDIVVKEAWTGPARLQLFEHAMAPLADLPVLEVVSASHILTDLTLSPVTSVHDYLNSGSPLSQEAGSQLATERMAR